MNKIPAAPTEKPAQQGPADAQKVKGLQEKSEREEVAGRHQNSGQKDHKGAR